MADSSLGGQEDTPVCEQCKQNVDASAPSRPLELADLRLLHFPFSSTLRASPAIRAGADMKLPSIDVMTPGVLPIRCFTGTPLRARAEL
jgi:hypothetical protein